MSASRRRRSSSRSSDDSNEHDGETQKCGNVFRNDGSFLEMFKRMQKTSQQSGATPSNPLPTVSAPKDLPVSSIEEEQLRLSTPKTVPPFIGRRRSTKALPIGKVKKLKTSDDDKPASKDAWAKYLDEVKKYKETYCDAEDKNRPLVK